MAISWRARLCTLAIGVVMRRARWGDAEVLARRARRLCGAPNPLSWLRSRGVSIEPVSAGDVRGEWVSAPGHGPGAVLYIHGGGYVAGSPAMYRPITAGLARLTGRRVFSLDYRLAPEHRFPAALDDAIAAYRWLLGQGIAPGTVAFAGDSAGGGLVLAALLRARDEGLPAPACGVCFSAWTDLARADIPDLARLYLGDVSPRHPYTSPLYADLRALPPVLLQVGADELLADDSRRVHEAIVEAGGRSTLEVSEGVFHVWQILDGFLPEARAALRRAASFIASASR